MTRICRHCSKCPVNRPRGLCWSCYYTSGVKDLYPSTSPHARRGVDILSRRVPRLPDRPTTAPPGTEDKITVMEARAKAGRAIFHPRDAQFAGDPRPLRAASSTSSTSSSPASLAPGRRCPKLFRHRGGQACVSFVAANGKRRWCYLGQWGSEDARRGYIEFRNRWPTQLDESPKVRTVAPRYLELRGEVKRLATWARECGLNPITVAYRLDVLGWSTEKALTTPAKAQAVSVSQATSNTGDRS